MTRARTIALVVGAVAAAVTVARHGRRAATTNTVAGGILMGDAGLYDRLTGALLGSFYASVAADVAATAPPGARVLEVGCGPGHLSTRLAARGLDVTGVDLDPAMIERARANAERAASDAVRLSFSVGDAASLPFPDGSVDLAVSTLSMHHWSDPSAGLADIGRVLRPGGRALIWDFRPGAMPHPFAPRHAHEGDPLEDAAGLPLRVMSVTPWRWPWRFTLTRRIELVR